VSKPLQREHFIQTVERHAAPLVNPRAPVLPAPPSPAFHGVPAASTFPGAAPRLRPGAVSGTTDCAPSSLVRWDYFREQVGDDPHDNREMLKLCLDNTGEVLPRLRAALVARDQAALKKIAHYLCGSLGIFGVHTLIQLSQDIDRSPEIPGDSAWHVKGERLCELLDRFHNEIAQRLAAN
jgi:HPt (histidine-containing phosphotransfer) domain-containing protein